MAKKAFIRGANVGTTFIMVVFVLLCLTTFATLSLVSANADRKLTLRSQEALIAYYKADTAAVLVVDEINNLLMQLSSEFQTEQVYLDAVVRGLEKFDVVTQLPNEQSRVVELSFQASERQMLSVALLISPLDEPTRYTITRWQVVQTAEWTPDGQPNIWDGLLGGF